MTAQAGVEVGGIQVGEAVLLPGKGLLGQTRHGALRWRADSQRGLSQLLEGQQATFPCCQNTEQWPTFNFILM